MMGDKGSGPMVVAIVLLSWSTSKLGGLEVLAGRMGEALLRRLSVEEPRLMCCP